MCAFDHPNSDGAKCHFTAYQSNVCYLGTLDGEKNELNNPISTELYLKISRCLNLITEFRSIHSKEHPLPDTISSDNIRSTKFPHLISTGSAKEKFIFAKLMSITHTEDTCSSICFTHIPSTPACHFFILHGGECMLGNFGFNGALTLPSVALSAYYNESMF